MTIQHRADVAIGRLPGDVFGFVADPANLPAWARAVVAVEPMTAGPPATGSRFRVRGKVLGVPMTSPYEITQLEPPRLLRGAGVAGPVRFEETYTFTESHGGMTVISYEIEAHGRGPFRFLELLLAPMLRRILDGDLERLRTRLAPEPA